MKDTNTLLGDFLHYLEAERRYSPHTVNGYQRHLAGLSTFSEGCPFAEITSQQIRRFIMRLHQQGTSASSLTQPLAAWRSFYQWGIKHKHFTHNPAKGIRSPKSSKRLPKALGVDQMMALLEQVPAPPIGQASTAKEQQNYRDWARDLAMFELLYSCGLRLSELIGLDTIQSNNAKGWIDMSVPQVTVTGKGGKIRVVPIGSRAITALQNWLILRPQALIPSPHGDNQALFLDSKGRRVNSNLIYQRIKHWGQSAQIPVHIHPHVLRHSFASHLLQSSGDLRGVQELLGHAHIATTQIYTHLDFQQLAKTYDQNHPRAKRKAILPAVPLTPSKPQP